MKALRILWKFSRPHTIIGSVVSISALYVMACPTALRIAYLPLLIIAIVTGVCCNIFIVGINQIEDIAIDKINKPYLPLASGELSVTNAYRIIYTAMFISIVCSAYISLVLLGVVCISLFIGMAYSLPPFYFKKHHLPAALAITTVRGLLVNLGGFYVFTYKIQGHGYISSDVYLLVSFILAFSIAIAWFKDLPDMTGDARYNIRTLAILYSPRTTFYAGTILVSAAYLFNAFYVLDKIDLPNLPYLKIVWGNMGLLLIFWISAIFVNLESEISIKRFYKRFWLFFFAEYALYLIAFF